MVASVTKYFSSQELLSPDFTCFSFCIFHHFHCAQWLIQFYLMQLKMFGNCAPALFPAKKLYRGAICERNVRQPGCYKITLVTTMYNQRVLKDYSCYNYEQPESVTRLLLLQLCTIRVSTTRVLQDYCCYNYVQSELVHIEFYKSTVVTTMNIEQSESVTRLQHFTKEVLPLYY